MVFIDFLKSHPKDAEILVSDERAYLRDTAGGLKFAEPLLGDSERVLLYNVDILSSIDIPALLAHHVNSGADVTLAVRDRQTSRYLLFDPADLALCGWKNVQTGQVILQKPVQNPLPLAFSGIHVLDRKVINKIPSVEKQSLVPFYVENVNELHIKGFCHQQDDWCDVGKFSEFSKVLS